MFCWRKVKFALGQVVVPLRDDSNKNGLPLFAEVHFMFGCGLLLFGKGALFVTDTADIVHADIVELCQQNETVHGDTGLALFVITVGALAHLKQCGDLGLGLVGILPEGADAFGIRHGNHIISAYWDLQCGSGGNP